MHKNLFAPQTLDLLETLALIFLYNFHREHGLIKLIRKKLSPKINVKNIKNRVVGYSIFVQYFSVIDAFIRPILMTFSPTKSFHLSKCKIKGIYSCLRQHFISFKLKDIKMY